MGERRDACFGLTSSEIGCIVNIYVSSKYDICFYEDGFSFLSYIIYSKFYSLVENLLRYFSCDNV